MGRISCNQEITGCIITMSKKMTYTIKQMAEIENWRYDKGYRKTYGKSEEGIDYHFPSLEGWRCHVYTPHVGYLEHWLKENMKGEYSFEKRLSFSKIVIVLFIKEDEDATFFKLNWQ